MFEANKELSRRFTELFSTGDEALADEILSAEVVLNGTAGDGELRGVDALKGFVAGYRRAFPDAQSRVEDQVAEGDRVVTRWRARGTHRGELGPIAATDGRRHDRANRRRQDRRGVGARDELSLLRQLGVLPEPQPAGR